MFLSIEKWITPHVSGKRPRPCSNLTLLSLSANRVLLYGGSNHDGYQIDTIYISTITGYALVSVIIIVL